VSQGAAYPAASMPAAEPELSSFPIENAIERWAHALEAARLLARNPDLGGVILRARPGPVRDAWIKAYRERLPARLPFITLPAHTDTTRLLGGLDFAATLAAGNPVTTTGLLDSAAGGVLICSMAERMTPARAAILAARLDDTNNTFVTVLIDEGEADDPAPPECLTDRLAFPIDLEGIPAAFATDPGDNETPEDLAMSMPAPDFPDDLEDALAVSLARLGVSSLRLHLLCLRCARTIAARDARSAISEDDIITALRLVLAGRTDPLPEPPPPEPDDPPPPDQNQSETEKDDASHSSPDEALEDRIVEAVQSGLIDLRGDPGSTPRRMRQANVTDGKSGLAVPSWQTGRRIGTRAKPPEGGKRIDILATLTAAAPWQRLRREGTGEEKRLHILPSDLRIKQFEARQKTLIIFVVDISGSAAIQRLGEAKGAVEYLLTDCYSRRDEVALIGFRGREAEILLPPTRSLVRMRQTLAGVPGGGPTPLADAISKAAMLGAREQRRGKTVTIVFLTDGKGNMTLEGTADRKQAQNDAELMARGLKSLEVQSFLFDNAKRPTGQAQTIAGAMGAFYRHLPYARGAPVANLIGKAVAGQRV